MDYRERSRDKASMNRMQPSSSSNRDRPRSRSNSEREKSFSRLRPDYEFTRNSSKLSEKYSRLMKEYTQLERFLGAIQTPEHIAMLKKSTGLIDKTNVDIANNQTIQRKIVVAQLEFVCRQLLQMTHHPILEVKFRIARDLLEADNVDSCLRLLDELIHRPTASKEYQEEYEKIIAKAGEIAGRMIAEEKVKLAKMISDQQVYNEKNKRKVEIEKQMRSIEMHLFPGERQREERDRESVRSSSWRSTARSESRRSDYH